MQRFYYFPIDLVYIYLNNDYCVGLAKKRRGLLQLLENLKTNRNNSVLVFLMVVLFVASLSTVLFELALTRVFSIILWYDYAFMAISIAFFGLGIGSLLIHIQKDYGQSVHKSRMLRWLSMPKLMTSSMLVKKITEYSIAYAISVPLFIFAIALIPPNTSYIYVFYLISSVPFFFAGSIMALVFFAMPRQINKLYFADLIGASSAALLLDPLMLGLGAESVLLLTSLLVAGSAIIGALVILRNNEKNESHNINNKEDSKRTDAPRTILTSSRSKATASIVLVALAVLLVVTSPAIMAVMPQQVSHALESFAKIHPGPNKGLYWQLKNPDFEHLSSQWNSFSRVDVTSQYSFNNIDVGAGTPVNSSHELAHIIIDADAGTPIFRWSGDRGDLAWMRQYMDYMPYELVTNTRNVLVIGGGGGEDIMMALAGGADKVTAVEINPLIVSAVKRFGGQNNVYDNKDVNLFIDDGRRFISSSSDSYDVITIKLVDSWAAQLAGGYALSENYLYTVEAFQQYYKHLNKDGMLVMIRWNFELPRLMPIVAESVAKETGSSMEDVSKQILVVEDRPGLYFGRTSDSQAYYPVLVMVRSTAFTNDQVNLVKQKAESGRADVTMLAESMIKPPYDKLFSSKSTYNDYVSAAGLGNPIIPTDNSPFYFAKEPVPQQMVILLATVLAISAVLSVILVYHARKMRRNETLQQKKAGMKMRTAGFVLFAVFIGLGFMVLEITFIQKFLLLLGTPIMALTVILFSILLSSGIGAYASGKLFSNRPHRAVFVSVPILVGIILSYLVFLQGIIDSSITLDLSSRAALTFALLFPSGLLMGFQFPSLIRMASAPVRMGSSMSGPQNNHDEDSNNTTLLWGINVVASILGTVLAAMLAMVIGFNGNLLVGIGLYAGAALSALLSLVAGKRYVNPSPPIKERE
jgi:predicted membrane-bound spermidine synthase